MKLIGAFLFFSCSILCAQDFIWVDYSNHCPEPKSERAAKRFRLVWNKDLVSLFENVYNELDPDARTPVQILQEMKSRDPQICQELSRTRVSSYLQKFRQRLDLKKMNLDYILD